MNHKPKPARGNFLIIGQRGGRYWHRGRRETLEEASALAAGIAHCDKGVVQNTYHVVEIRSSFINQPNYNPRRPK